MNNTILSAFFDELEKISEDPFAGDPRFTTEGMARARAEAPQLSPKPIQYAPTRWDLAAQVPPRPAPAVPAGPTSRIGRLVSKVGPRGRMAAGLGLAGLTGLGIGQALG